MTFEMGKILSVAHRLFTVHVLFMILETDWFLHSSWVDRVMQSPYTSIYHPVKYIKGVSNNIYKMLYIIKYI